MKRMDGWKMGKKMIRFALTRWTLCMLVLLLGTTEDGVSQLLDGLEAFQSLKKVKFHRIYLPIRRCLVRVVWDGMGWDG